jgi:predicted RNA-binding Zn-ribbon protein involved in translation (DUF1610 family)
MAMALESWGGLRFGLMALGYQQVIWTHLHCFACGVFKLAIAEELEEYPCPACGAACKVAIIAQGFTRHELPPAERISKPLSSKTRLELMRPEKPIQVRPRRVPDRHAQKLKRGIPVYQSACDSRPRASIVRSWAMPDF